MPKDHSVKKQTTAVFRQGNRSSRISDYFNNHGKKTSSLFIHQRSKKSAAVSTSCKGMDNNGTVSIINNATDSSDSDIEIIGYEDGFPKSSKEPYDLKRQNQSKLASSTPEIAVVENCELSLPQSSYCANQQLKPNINVNSRLSLKRKWSKAAGHEESVNDVFQVESKIIWPTVDKVSPPYLSTSSTKHKIGHSDYMTAAESPQLGAISTITEWSTSSSLPVNTSDNDEIKDENSSDKMKLENTEPSNNIFKVPYYLQNFECVLKAVMEDETYTCLFNAQDKSLMTQFLSSSDGAKKLYVRMFSRKLNWINQSKLKYDEIADDLCPYLKELVDMEFIDCEDKLNDLKDVLGALSASDIKILAKSYHIAPKITQKKTIVQELLKKSQQTSVSRLLGNKGGGLAIAILKSAKTKLKDIYKLRLVPRSVFVRVLMLFSIVNTTRDEDESMGGQSQLFQMLMVNMGKVAYPSYKVTKCSKIFKNRDDVIRFEHALQLESDLLKEIQKGNWEGAYDIYKIVVKQVDYLEKDKDIAQFNANLPDFLRSFTATSVLYGLLSAAIEIVQRRKEFHDAVELLRKLLGQTTYCCTYRGYWWERLALNLDAHLKDPNQALKAVEHGLADIHVKVGHRFALFKRAEIICQRPQFKLKNQLKNFHHEPVRELPKVLIEGRVLHMGVLSSGLKFLTESSCIDGNAHDMTVCGVEEFVMDYYKNKGFPSSIHAEGSIVTSLFGLYFWDILFMSVPDAFHSPYQTMPLDFYSETFYSRRKDFIDKRIQELESNSLEVLHEIAEESWTKNHGIMCIGISWDRIKSLDTVKEIVTCMGGKVLSGILERYAKCPRHTRSGFPDLTLWNIDTKTFKICEVKGPGDRLSHKQILWINFLLGLGVDAEVCHVKAVAAKKLKPSSAK